MKIRRERRMRKRDFPVGSERVGDTNSRDPFPSAGGTRCTCVHMFTCYLQLKRTEWHSTYEWTSTYEQQIHAKDIEQTQNTIFSVHWESARDSSFSRGKRLTSQILPLKVEFFAEKRARNEIWHEANKVFVRKDKTKKYCNKLVGKECSFVQDSLLTWFQLVFRMLCDTQIFTLFSVLLSRNKVPLSHNFETKKNSIFFSLSISLRHFFPSIIIHSVVCDGIDATTSFHTVIILSHYGHSHHWIL